MINILMSLTLEHYYYYVLSQLLLEEMIVERLLKFLVTVVDTHLLESVRLEDLKTKDIQHSDDLIVPVFESELSFRHKSSLDSSVLNFE